MDAQTILESARKAVDDAKLPEDLRLSGFKFTLEYLSGTAPNGQLQDQGKGNGAGGDDIGAGAHSGIATALGIRIEQVGRLFDDHEGELQFIGDPGQLGKTKSTKVAKLATLYAVARQAGKYDEGATNDSAIRAEIDRNGLLDPGNYSKHMALIKRYFNVNGSGKSATYKAKYEGRQQAKDIAMSLLGD